MLNGSSFPDFTEASQIVSLRSVPHNSTSSTGRTRSTEKADHYGKPAQKRVKYMLTIFCFETYAVRDRDGFVADMCSGRQNVDALNPKLARDRFNHPPRCMNTVRMLMMATRAASNHIHCQIEPKCFATQRFEGTSVRFANSAEPAETNLSFQRSKRPIVIPSSSLTVSTDSPLSKRRTAAVFAWLVNRE